MNSDGVIKIDTYKSGRFVFSCKYDINRIFSLLIENGVLIRTVNDLPILPNLASNLHEELIRRAIFGTAAIEGNPLSQEQVDQVLSQSKTFKTTEKAEKEIQNLKITYDYLRNLRNISQLKLDEDYIKKLHELITYDVEYESNIPGKYRNHIVKVGDIKHGGVYTPPKIYEDIKNLMSEYIKWINSESVLKLAPEIRAALAHLHFSLIHPFGDGNGRTARIIEAFVLYQSGIKYVPVMLSNYYYRNIDDYYVSFSKTIMNEENDVTDFIEFILKGVKESLYNIKDSITFFIRKFTLRDYYYFLRQNKLITSRQYDLLILLLDHQESFTLQDLKNKPYFNLLFRNVSERTARRDLIKLKSRNLLNRKNGNFEINFKYLEEIM